MALVAIVYSYMPSIWSPPQLNKLSIPWDVKINAVREHRVLIITLQPEGVRYKRHKEIAIITALLKWNCGVELVPDQCHGNRRLQETV